MIRAIHKSLMKRDTSAVEICNKAFKKIQETSNLNAFITTCENEALVYAQRLDEQLLGSSKNFGTLHGITISIKDNICTKDVRTTCGSKMLHNFIPPYDATVVDKLKDAGCIITGKTNMDEFAMGSSCTTSYYGPAANSWKGDLLNGKRPTECDNPNNWYMAGGSSTGSAVSVASGACFASIGTDTGGSARQPASLTGIVGFKPTYGLISRHGLIPLAHCLDVVSILARSVDDVKVVFEQIIGLDERDLSSVSHKELRHTNFSPNPTIRIGIPEEFIFKGELSQDVADKFDLVVKRLSSGFSKCGNFEIINVSLPHANLATECYTIISSSEIASNMSCYDGVKYGFSMTTQDDQVHDRETLFKANRDAALGSEIKKRILLGNYFLLSENREKYLVQAQRVRRLISDDFSRTFKKDKLDVILLPSTPTTSITYADWLSKDNENRLFGEDYYLIPANLANIPSISVPCGFSSTGLPVGLQLLVDRYCDFDLLSIADLLERYVLDQ